MKKDSSKEWIEVQGESEKPRVTKVGDEIQISHTGKPLNINLKKKGLVYLTVDRSGSMAGEKLTQAKQGAVGFAEEAREKGYLTGLICFGSVASHICSPQEDMSTLQKEVGSVNIAGSTNMTGGIDLAVEKLSNRKGNRVIVVVTDGMPDNSGTALASARRAKKEGIDIITIGTNNADYNFLKKLASRNDLATTVQRKQLKKRIVSTADMLPEGE